MGNPGGHYDSSCMDLLLPLLDTADSTSKPFDADPFTISHLLFMSRSEVKRDGD